MPLQQINLDQSIYNKPKDKWGGGRRPGSVVSEALQPPQGGGGFAAAGGNLPNSFVEEQKAIWAEEDKLKKAERDAELMKAQEIGMRVQDEAKKEQETTMAQIKQQQVAKQQIESNPEAAAEEMWKFYLTLPEENQKMLLDQISKPISSGSTINGKPISGEKYNAIFNNWLQKGRVIFDSKGNVTVNEPEREFEKGTYVYNAEDNLIINSATGETIVSGDDIPKGITPTEILDVIKEARAYTTGLVDPSMIEGLTPEGRSTFFERADKKFKEHVSWILQNTYNMSLKEATKIANGIPKEDTIAAPTDGETTTDPTIVGDLTKLFKENPDEIANRKAYEDKYGAENVAAALGETNKPKPTSESITKEFKALGYPTSPSGQNKQGASSSAF